jgi:RNA polymerase sigma factor (sigma-70 family)
VERWIKGYPEYKTNLPSAPDLFTFHLFDRVERIERALRKLDQEEQRLLDLFYCQNKSYIAVSFAMHMSRSTVYRSKMKLLHKLAKEFGL